MPHSVEADASTGVVVVVLEGEVSVEGIRSAMLNIWQSPVYREHLRVLWDLRKGSTAHLSAGDGRELSLFEKHERPEGLAPSKVAFLVDGDSDFGMMRMFGVYMPEELLDINVFREAEAAWRWLAE